MQKVFIFSGALLAMIGVAAGAFGAHALKQKLSVELLNIFEVGVKYQMYHALALVALGFAQQTLFNTWMAASGISFIGGSVIFSGSLYILALTGVRSWGMITPIGGVFFVIGWLLLMIGAFK